MSTARIQSIGNGFLFSALGAIAGAASGAATGGIGASVLNATGNVGHSVAETLAMTVAGNTVIGATSGLLTPVFLSFFNARHDIQQNIQRSSANTLKNVIISYALLQAAGSLTGYVILSSISHSSINFLSYLAEVGVGSAITTSAILIFSIVAIVCAATAKHVNFNNSDCLNNRGYRKI